MRWVALILLAGLVSCEFPSAKYRSYPKNPYSRLRKIVVLPFINRTRHASLDVEMFSNNFASELTRFSGFDVIRPIDVMAVLEKGETIRSVDDAVKVGRRLQADAILAVAVTDYDPYDPPRTALQVQLLRTRAQRMSAEKIDEIIQSASWRIGPYTMSVGRAGYLVDAFQRIWDAHAKNVRSEVRNFADAMEDKDTAFRNENEILAVQDRWMQFVANQAINLLVERANPYELQN
jgi:hypothetical protein